MFKFIISVVSAIVLMSPEGYCQQKVQAQQESTVFGRVVTLDVEGGVIEVETGKGKMVFYIATESDLYQSSHHMSSVEITKGDPVKIQYIISSGRNNIISLVDNKPIQ